MKDKRAFATAASFTALAFNGMTYTFMGTSLPVIQSQLGISLAGALIATFQMGVTNFSLIGGIFSDLFRRERITMTGSLMLGGTFLIQAKSCSLGVAGSALSLFAVFMVLRRIICSRLTLFVKHATIILTLLWLQVATLVLAWHGQGWLSVVACIIALVLFQIYHNAICRREHPSQP